MEDKQKFTMNTVNKPSIDEIHSECDCIDGSIVNGVRELI